MSAGSYAVAIDEVGDADGFRIYPVSSEVKRDFRRRLVEGLRRLKVSTEINDPPLSLASILFVRVKIGRAITGGGLMGFGPGRRHDYAYVELHDGEKVFRRFRIWKRSDSPWGWRFLANETARAIDRLSRGELTPKPLPKSPPLRYERPEDARLATSLNNLAGFYQIEGKYAEAEPLYKRALAIREKVPAPEHTDVADSLNNLAELYRVQSRYAEAKPLYQRSLTIWEKALGPEHRDVATSLNNLARHYHAQGRYPEGEPLYLRSLAIREKVLGPEHPDVATSLENYAALLHETGRAEQAERMEARAKMIRAKSE